MEMKNKYTDFLNNKASFIEKNDTWHITSVVKAKCEILNGKKNETFQLH
jgi:hypothetical protein